MVQIFDFNAIKSKRENIDKKRNMIDSIDDLVSEGLKETPKIVSDILNTPDSEIVIINDIETFRKLVFEYIVNKMDKNHIIFNPNITSATTYISDLIYKFGFDINDELKEMIDDPYFIHWIEKGEFKKAGDVSVYNYIFYPKGDRNHLRKDEYLKFAMNGYCNFAGEDFAQGIGKVLPFTSNLTKDLPFSN